MIRITTMHIRIIQSIALLSLLQAVFSKRSADSLQLYLTTTSDNTDSGANSKNSASIYTSRARTATTNSSARVSNNSHLNTFYLKKRGMAFVHSKVRETRERTGKGNIPKPFQYFNNNNHGAGAGTGMFTSLLSCGSSGPNSRFRSRNSSKLNFSFNLNDSWKKICGDDGDGNNGDEENCDVAADLEFNLEPRLENKVSSINNINNKNNKSDDDDDETSPPSQENLSMPLSKDFPLASLIN
eukprot:794252_1